MSGKFRIVLSDPPWAFNDLRKGRGGCAAHYSTMTVDELVRLPVHTLAAPISVLFLWVPAALTREGLVVMRAWGFEFRTCAFVWLKRGTSGKLAWGNGQYTRANAEMCWLGVRGSPKVASHAVHQVIEAPRGEHSAKPPEVRNRIVQLCGDVSRVELFAREAVPGWARFGDQAPAGDGFVDLVQKSGARDGA